MISTFYNKKTLVAELVKRDFTQSYKGSVMGLVWVFVNPLLMLGIYSLTFGYILNARSGMPGGNKEYVLTLFAGLILFSALAEAINKGVRLVTSNQNFVKKIVFPLEILALVSSLSIMAHLLISFVLMVVVQMVFISLPNITIFYSILIFIVFFPVLLGVGWLFASIGALFRDLQQLTGVITHALLFLSPIFYRLGGAPELVRRVVDLNPLTFIVSQLREVVIAGNSPDFSGLLSYFLIAIIFAFLSYLLFMLFNKVYADIL